jgi:hypothetical protein
MFFGIMKVGMDSKNLAKFDLESSFLLDLPKGRFSDCFLPFNVSTRNAPSTCPSFAEPKPLFVKQNNRDAYRGVAVPNPSTARAS